MPSIPIYFDAKQVTAMQFTPQIPAADGTLTAGTAVNMKTLQIFDRLEYTADRNLYENSPSDALIENFQSGKITFTATLSALDKNGKANPIIDLFMGYDYVVITAQGTEKYTGGVAQKALTLYAAIGSLTTGYMEGKNTSGITLRPCGILPIWALPS